MMSEDSSGFDVSAGANWIYPTNLPIRDYQYNIVQHALFKNTLVCLPTGLGKTFIAAVVMYNFYRWYPKGKIVFMTPTRPLVAQQIDACYNVMGIPQEDMTEMTGTQQPASRAEMWRSKRIFFLTPQVFINDLGRGVCNGATIRCLVIDEAHKAQKNHAYCQVVRDLCRVNSQFRVLALSATPGNDIKDVQQVVNNILISHVEIRSEESIDVQPYTHHKQVEKVVVSLEGNLSSIVDKYLSVAGAYVQRLQEHRVLYAQAAANVTKFMLLKAREKFRQDPPHLPAAFIGRTEADFAIAMSLYHGLELVQLHGPRSLYNFLQGVLHGDKASPRVRAELMKNESLMELFSQLGVQFDPNQAPAHDPDAPALTTDLHPKMKAVEEVVLKHFLDYQNGADGKPQETRVIVFAQYRDTVDEIKRLLERHRPLIKPVVFIGHGGSTTSSTAGGGGAKKGRGRGKVKNDDENSNDSTTAVPVPGRVAAAKMSQKDQLFIMERFRRGDFNTLVATSIVEEGLDIGEVDLIVCYDAHRSPIRLVQRMGRTGRKRNGKCVMLVTAGREDAAYEQGVKKRRALNRSVENSRNTLQFFQENPRMVPDNLKPQPLLIEVKPPEKSASSTSVTKAKGRGRAATKRTSKSRLSGAGHIGDELPPVEDIKDEDFKKPPPPVTAADYVEALTNELYSQPNEYTKKPQVIVIDEKPTVRRKRTKIERSDSGEATAGTSKQRKVYEFFAAPAKSASSADQQKENIVADDDVVVLEGEEAKADTPCPTLKQRLSSIIAQALPCEAVATFNAMLESTKSCPKSFPVDYNEKDFSFSYFRPPFSWSDFSFEAFMHDVTRQLEDLDFKKMQCSTAFLSPPNKPTEQLAKPLSYLHLTSSTPKAVFAAAPPAPPSTASTAKNSSRVSSDSMINISQALDILSMATPKPVALSFKTPNPTASAAAAAAAAAAPVTASKQAPGSVVRSRYISPVIESLAAAYRRKQNQVVLPRSQENTATNQNQLPIINFDIDFDMDISNIENNKSFKYENAIVDIDTKTDDFGVNFDLEFDFASADEPAPLTSASIYCKETLATVDEKPEFDDEILDDELLAALTHSPEPADLPPPSPVNIVKPFQPLPVRPSSEVDSSPIIRRVRPSANQKPSKLATFKSFPQPKAYESSCFIVDDDDDDFKPIDDNYFDKPSTSTFVGKSLANVKSESDDTPSPIMPGKRAVKNQRKQKTSKHRRLARQFLSTQAEQSDSESSFGSENSDDDRDLSSFVDPDQYSPINTQDHAMYLRLQINDHRTPKAVDGRFKLSYRGKADLGASAIFSQTPGNRSIGEDTYMEDSFCVKDDFVEFESSPSVVDTPKERKKQRRNKEPRRRMVIISEDEDEIGDEAEIAAAVEACQPSASPEPDPAHSHNLDSAPYHHQQSHSPIMTTAPAVKCQPLSPTREASVPMMPESPQILSQTARRVQQQSTIKRQLEEDKIAIIISPRELQSAQAVISELRTSHAPFVYPIIRSSTAASVPGLDYVLSCRSAVTRVRLSNLIAPSGNAQTRKKAIEEISNLASIVDNPVVILEEDVGDPLSELRIPHDKERSKLYATTQVGRLLVQSSVSGVRILFSSDAVTTASLLVDLVKEEDRDGAAVRITEAVSSELLYGSAAASNGLAARMKFFEAVGQAITPMIALRLALNFPVLRSFFESNVDLSALSISTCARQALTRLRSGRYNNNNNNASVNQAAKVSSKQFTAQANGGGSGGSGSDGGVVRRS